MNTGGLNLGLPLRGTTDLSSKAKSSKEDKAIEARSEQGPDSFAKVMSAKNSPAPRKENVSVAKKGNEEGPRRTDSTDDKPSVKEEKFEGLEKPKGKKAGSERDKAMQEFMDSMESEFGIPPTKIVEAMAKLPDGEMLQAPEDTASQVIDSLDLPPEQAEKAYSMYAGLLGQLSQMPPQVAQPKAGTELGTHAELSMREKRNQLNESLDRLSQKFFMQDLRPSPSSTADRVNQISDMNVQAKGAEGLVDRMDFAKTQDLNDPSLLRTEKMVPENGLPQGPKPSAEFFENAMNKSGMEKSKDQDDSTQTLMAKLSALGASAAALGKAVEKTPNGQRVVEAGNADSGALNAGPEFSLSSALMRGAVGAGGGAAAGGFDSDDSDSQDDGNLKNADALSGHVRGDQIGHTEKGLGFKELMQASVPGAKTENGPNPNIEKLMNQAQMIVRKGGGEATIRMSPEGMGEVHLRVVVKDGKVNVEMATESKEAKQMIESSLADLKAGLGQHKLSVESVKVDVGLNGQHDHGSQKQPDLNQQNPGRDQARQFFQQFREDNLAKREPFFDMPGARAYARPSQGPKPLGPTEEARAKTRMDGRGERMNLVA